MKRVPFSIIVAAKQSDMEAIEFIRRHFEGYIANRCLTTYTDQYGSTKSSVDDDLRYHADIALLSAIFTFQFRDPPPNFLI